MDKILINWKKFQDTFMGISELFSDLNEESLSKLPTSKTALVVVDMVNGFVKDGPMSSQRVYSINKGVADLVKRCSGYGILCLAFHDCHSNDSPEFLSYPPHCLMDTRESLVTEEILAAGPLEVIPKNSTNGFLEPLFTHWLSLHPAIDHFIIVGDCTDICISQFATTLKADFNRQNRGSRVIVPVDLVETYDGGLHDGDVMNTVALYEMSLNGIELVSTITE